MNKLQVTLGPPGFDVYLGLVRVTPRKGFPLDSQALFCTECGEVWARLISSDPLARWHAVHTKCERCGGNGSTLSYLWHRRILHVDRTLALHELSTFSPTTPDRIDLVAAG